MVLDEAPDETPIRATAPVQSLLAVAAAGVIFFGLIPTPLLDAAQAAAETLV